MDWLRCAPPTTGVSVISYTLERLKLLTSFLEQITAYLTPIVLLISFVTGVVLLFGHFHKFRFKYHHLEHTKLKLEIEKLKRDLGFEPHEVVSEIENPSNDANTAWQKTTFKLRYRALQALKFSMFPLGFIAILMTVAALVVAAGEDKTPGGIILPFLLLDVILYGSYVYIDEWLKCNQEKI